MDGLRERYCLTLPAEILQLHAYGRRGLAINLFTLGAIFLVTVLIEQNTRSVRRFNGYPRFRNFLNSSRVQVKRVLLPGQAAMPIGNLLD